MENLLHEFQTCVRLCPAAERYEIRVLQASLAKGCFMKFIRHRQVMIQLFACAALCMGASVLRAQAPAADRAGNLLVGQLVDDARAAGRNLQLPPELAARESLVLLQKAHRLNPASSTVLRLLAEAAGALHRTALQRKALLQLVNLQPGNMQAQLKFLDSLAAGAQTVGKRITIYRRVMNRPGLDPQIKSALALRIGQLLNAQAHHRAASGMFVQAVKLNSANLAAWQELTLSLEKSHASPAQLLYCYLQTLHCDPFQPDAMAGAAHLLAAAGHYRLAAKWADSAVVEMQQGRAALTGELPTDLAAYWAITRQEDQLRPYLDELLAFKKPSTRVLMIALADYSGSKPVTGAGAKKILARIENRLAAALKARPDSIQLKSDALWLKLVYQAKLPHNIAAQVAAMQKPLAAAPALYARLRGWQLLRQGNLHAAAEKFALGKSDPYAVIGLAEAKAGLGDKKTATSLLLALWRSSPPWPVALAVAQAADNLKIHLSSTAAGNALAVQARGYSSRFLHAVFHPSNIVLVSVHWPRRFPDYGRPIYIHVHYYNESPWSLAVGPNTAITTSLAMAAQIQGVSDINLGAYAIDSDPTVLRLDSHQSLEVTYQINQGVLRALSLANPDSLIGGRLRVITNPAADGTDIYPGPGGQSIDAGYFNVRGFFSGGLKAMAEQASRFSGLPPYQQMIAAGAMSCVLPRLKADLKSAQQAGATASPSPADIGNTIKIFTTQLQSILTNPADTRVQAWVVRLAPRKNLPASIGSCLAAAAKSSSSMVRMMAYWRMLMTAQDQNTPQAMAAVKTALAGFAHHDTDSMAARWAADLARQAAIVPHAAAKK